MDCKYNLHLIVSIPKLKRKNLFFDLLLKINPKADIKSQKIWELSEVFNGLIMSEPEFIKITGNNKIEQYPNLINLQKQMSGLWKENKTVDNFIKKALY